jgi:hypothetical protein
MSMEKIVKGFYRSSFSTTTLESKNRDINYRNIYVEGRKTLQNTEEISEFPPSDYFSKLDMHAWCSTNTNNYKDKLLSNLVLKRVERFVSACNVVGEMLQIRL